MEGVFLYASHKKQPYSSCTKEGKVSDWGRILLAIPPMVKYNNYLAKAPAFLQHFSQSPLLLPFTV